MEGKKISFSFMKTKKLERLPLQEKKDFIECVEEKSIKVIGGEEVKEIVPLVIPMKPNTLITTERLKEIAEKVESALEEPEKVDESPKPQKTVPENETLEQMAVRELLADSRKEVKVDAPQLTLLLPSKSVSSGEKESTLDDYESVPVKDFGLAMLRGMGWTKTTEKSSFKPPRFNQLRPKGLGLGADKVVKDKQKVAKNSKDEELTIVKNAYVKITNGKYSGYYGKVLSLDDDNGRVMVDITVKKETVSLSEFMMHPVSKSEFDKESKVINADSFEKYKKNEGQATSKSSEKESSSRRDRNNRNEDLEHEREGNDNNNHRGTEHEKQSDNKERNRDRTNRERRRDSSDEKYRKSNRDSSQESLSDDSRRKHKKERKSKKHYSSMESLNSDTDKLYKKKERRRSSDSESDKRKKSDKEQKKQDDDLKGKKSDERRRHDSDLKSDRNSKKTEKERRYSSDSESDDRARKKKEERRRHDSDSDQQRSKRSDTPEGKRDIDKKRKGKKKKRDRDRSPNYRKHRK